MNHGTAEVDAYIATFPPEVQAALQSIRALVRAEVPDATEALKYQIPTFVLGENLVHYAAFTRHIGWYPTPSAMVAFAGELTPFKRAKGSVQFPHTAPLPLDLIRRMVAFRVREVRARRGG